MDRTPVKIIDMLPVYNSHERLTLGTEEATGRSRQLETNGALFRHPPAGCTPVAVRR